MQITKDTRLCLSIVSTGKCNCNCSYCHFYASHKRADYNRDIDSELFDRYVDYIRYLQGITPHISVRLSGGEPLYMGEKVFFLTDYIFDKTGIKPYIMTNGKLLCSDIIEQAYIHHVSSFVVSVENPFSVSSGAVDAEETIRKFAELQNDKAPLYWGMLVLENSQFCNIRKIADLFYARTRIPPPMCEINYLPYSSPTDDELRALYDNVRSVVMKYNNISPIALFPYIVPEYYPGNRAGVEYLTEFPIDDKHLMLQRTNEELITITSSQIDSSYFSYNCKHMECDWYDSCKQVKWVWKMDTSIVSAMTKMADYCRMKKCLSNAFFDALIERR